MTHEESRERKRAIIAAIEAGMAWETAMKKFHVSRAYIATIVPKETSPHQRRKQATIDFLKTGESVEDAMKKFRIKSDEYFRYIFCKRNGISIPARTRGGDGCRQDPKWNSVDWTKRDVDLSKIYNVSRERIRQVRKSRGVPYRKTA